MGYPSSTQCWNGSIRRSPRGLHRRIEGIITIRIAVAGIHHESNTFSNAPADLTRFEAGGIARLEEIRQRYADSHSTPAGFLEAGDVDGVDVVPLLYANVNPCGPLTHGAYLFLANEILAHLDREGPWDGVLLAQHGAAVADGTPDMDGDFVTQVRSAVGEDTPIGVAIDMHANVSTHLIDVADVVVAYQTNPHVDPRLRARHCANLILDTITGNMRPAMAFVPVPLALHIGLQDTSTGAISELLAVTRTVGEEYGLMSASLVEGFPYADVPQMGMSVITAADGNADAARDAAELIATEVWNHRNDLTTTLPIPADALQNATSTDEPTLVLDVGDNIGGGSTGDSTALLHEARNLGVTGLFQTLFDPDSVSECVKAGTGVDMDLTVGGKQPGSPTPGFPIRGRVVATSSGVYEDPTPTHGGYRYFDAGPSVAVETDDGHMLLLTSKLVPNTSLEQLRHIGLDPASFSILVGKGVNAPKAAYQPIVDRMLYADTPGVTTANLDVLDYQNRGECFPFEDLEWKPKAHLGARFQTRDGTK